MPAIVTQKTRLFNAKNFKEAFTERNPDVAYLFIGRSSAWTPDDLTPPDPDESVSGELDMFTEALAYKKITPSNISSVIKRFDWTSGQQYDPYDDTEKDIVNRTNPLYVLTDQGNVYKCIDRPDNTASTVKPTGQSLTTFETGDGYVWKFMFDLSVTEQEKFLNSEWIPVKKLQSDDGSPQWDVQQSAIDGGIHRIKVTDGGSGYSTASVSIDAPSSGTQATATANIVGGAIDSIDITDPGSGYRDYPTINITGDGSGATGQAVLSPRGGHGANPVEELNGIYVMVLTELDDTEGGDFPVGTSFRRVAILANPRLESETGIELEVTSPGVNSRYAVGDVVTGQSSGATGEVVKWDYVNNILTLKNVTGTFSNGESVQNGAGVSSSINQINTNVNLPATELTYQANEIKDEVGDIIYVENRVPIQRNESQTEQIRLVIEF